MNNTRAAAAQALAQVLGEGRSLDAVLPAVLAGLAPRERGLAQELCYGVLRWYYPLQDWLTQLLARPLKAREQTLQALLLIGLYQLLYLRMPDYAAVSEVVTAARALGKARAAGLVNAVLRNGQRQRAARQAMPPADPVARYAHPAWLLAQLQADWPRDWEAIVQANNERPPQHLRVNLCRLSQADYLARLQASEIAATAAPFAASGVTLAAACATDRLPGFQEGWASVQDTAAQLTPALLAPEPGQRVLDACAAPGGKTCHLLEYQPKLGRLLALDNSAERLQRVRDNLHRLGLAAATVVADATEPAAWWDGQPFDRILVDAPCSGSGVIRRHPDSKILRRATDVASLARRQRLLLERLWPLLAPAGKLLYATCSVFRGENEQVIAAFLAAQPTAREQPIAAAWGRQQLHGRQILPGEAGMDGFYYACLVKDA